MTDLIFRLAGLLLLRRGPQDLPPGWPALFFSIAAYVAVTAFNLSRGDGHPTPVAVITLAVGLPLTLTWIVLKIRQRTGRWVQTLTALFGSNALLSVLTLPFSLAAGSEPNMGLALILLTSFFWSFAVDAHIWRHALEISFAAALVVTMLLFVISLFVITSLTGPL